MAHTNRMSKVIAKAWKDPEFKKKLLADPKAAVKEMGIDIPKDVSVKVVEDTPQTLTIVLPKAPTNAKEIDEGALEKLAAGITGSKCEYCTPTPW